MSEFIQTEIHDKVLLLQITYEKTLNCLNNDILGEIAETLRAFNRNPQLRALVLTGAGRSFCTGADLKVFTELSQEDCVDYSVDYEEDIFRILSSSRKPTIAAVNGYALGGGMELALACDFRIGVEKCQFSAPEYNFGWVPGWGGVHRLATLVGPNKAKEILLLRKKIRGPEALEIGLLNELVDDPEQLIARALEMAASLAELNPLTVTYTKTILNDFYVPPYDSLAQGLTNSITSKSPYAKARVEEFFNRKK
ncbi:MAG: enoyl-CoA hydratase/isomerase family protein [Oscillospiraceae bacterium]|nr:enoyl-CoA hydratase/isomerase family protein [Oscillospiraceae bacterium]